MNVNRIRAIIAIVVIGIFMLITAIMAIYPIFIETKVDLNTYSDFFAKIASVYTGIIGVIIGYYFGRSKEVAESKKITSKSDRENV